jgi:hypothetical protein
MIIIALVVDSALRLGAEPGPSINVVTNIATDNETEAEQLKNSISAQTLISDLSAIWNLATYDIGVLPDIGIPISEKLGYRSFFTLFRYTRYRVLVADSDIGSPCPRY